MAATQCPVAAIAVFISLLLAFICKSQKVP